ncbi:MAG: nucleotidyltransferase domain-containing protein [Candidatus Aenigmarchaeota archaeon]|nr:nucleotidyltransferase domain-containing protein [Candidatus Aenigmarchaeota archaeon]
MNTISIPLSKKSEGLFRYKLTADILNFLIRNSYKSFSISELAKKINRKENDLLLRKTIKELEKCGLIEIRKEKKSYEISINRDFVYDPEDKLVFIPQDKYRAIIKEITDKLRGAHAIFLFGSVAEGTADRMSDIDLFVVSNSRKTTMVAEKIKFYFGSKRKERFKVNFYIETTRNFEKLVKNKEPVVLKILRRGIKIFSSKKFEKIMEGLAV